MSNKTDVLSFDELARFYGLSLMTWDEDNYASENTQLAKDFFEAGQQSKQGEVDKLQTEIDELQNKYDAMYRAFTVADDCRKEWHRCYVGIRQREDELKKRIDDLKYFCIKGVESNMLSIEYNQALIDMYKILKGEETK